METITIGDLIVYFYDAFLARYRDEELAALMTTVAVNEAMAVGVHRYLYGSDPVRLAALAPADAAILD